MLDGVCVVGGCSISLSHRVLDRVIDVSLKTDANGCIHLGHLKDVSEVCLCV
jgi:hypothetical protein